MADYADRLLKIIIVGNSGVGKSCLLMRYAENNFTTAFYSTIGVDFKMKNINLDGRKVRLQIWDTAGQERYRTITSSYYKNAHAVMLVYDVTDNSSFEALRFWQQEAEKYGSGDMVMIVVGNKIDKEGAREVSTEKAKEYAVSNKFEHIEVSALSDKNISEAFQNLSRLVIKKFQEVSPQSKTPQSSQVRQLQPQPKGGNLEQTGKAGCSC